MKVRMQFDGGANPNPGLGGCGAAIFVLPNTKVAADVYELVWQSYEFIGNEVTNNQAEYCGLISGLQGITTLAETPAAIEIFGDSDLVIKQMNKTNSTRDEKLVKLKEIADRLLETIKSKAAKAGNLPPAITYQHHSRNKNALPDQLARKAIATKSSERQVLQKVYF